jgi:hypothetical protein
MDKVASERKLEVNGEVHSESHFAATVDWNLVAVQLFFCTGHRCTFDGLHYTAAFIGYGTDSSWSEFFWAFLFSSSFQGLLCCFSSACIKLLVLATLL